MNYKLIILALLFITSGIFYYNLTGPSLGTEAIQVTRIIDGDTLEAASGQRIRLIGINTPESSMPFYEEAKDLLRDLVENKSVEIESHGTERYGRTLAYIFFDGKNINEEILRNGFATLYYYDKDNHYSKLKQAEEFARLNKKGLWAESPNSECLELIELKVEEPEKLILKNNCNIKLNIIFKDDATHIYKETINSNSYLIKNFSHIWNNAGDSIYIRDDKGLLIFYRY
jgi:micrococcal nuclease